MNIATAPLEQIKSSGLDELFSPEEAINKQIVATVLEYLRSPKGEGKPTAVDKLRLVLVFHLSAQDNAIPKDDVTELEAELKKQGIPAYLPRLSLVSLSSVILSCRPLYLTFHPGFLSLYSPIIPYAPSSFPFVSCSCSPSSCIKCIKRDVPYALVPSLRSYLFHFPFIVCLSFTTCFTSILLYWMCNTKASTCI
jgi:hypothetical protein